MCLRGEGVMTHLPSLALWMVITCHKAKTQPAPSQELLSSSQCSMRRLLRAPSLHWHAVRFAALSTPMYLWVFPTQGSQEISPDRS